MRRFDKISRVVGETEETEPLGQFHHGAGLGLLRGGAFAHLLFGSDQRSGVAAAVTEKDRDVQTAIVDPDGLIEDFQVELLQFCSQLVHGLFRWEDLVLIARVTFKGIL